MLLTLIRATAFVLGVLSLFFHVLTYGCGTIAGSLEQASNDLIGWID